jgi:hypothetical protein
MTRSFARDPFDSLTARNAFGQSAGVIAQDRRLEARLDPGMPRIDSALNPPLRGWVLKETCMRAHRFRSGHQGLRLSIGVAGSLMVGLLLAASVPAAAAGTAFNSNLVKNPGAENGTAHWDTFPPGDFKSRPYGPPGGGYPSKQTGNSISGGTDFFDGNGYNSAYPDDCGDAHQTILLQGIGGPIDNGHVQVVLSGYAGTGASNAHAHIDVQFFNAQHHTDNISVWGIKKQASNGNAKYEFLKGSHVLPKHTRQLDVHLSITGPNGCQAFWDKISVVLVHV